MDVRPANGAERVVPISLAVAKIELVWGEETWEWLTKRVVDDIPLLKGRILDFYRNEMDGVFSKGQHNGIR